LNSSASLGCWSEHIDSPATTRPDALAWGNRATLTDLDEARRFTAKLREQEQGLLAPAPQSRHSEKRRAVTADETIAETWRIAREEQRMNLRWGGRRVLFSVPVRS